MIRDLVAVIKVAAHNGRLLCLASKLQPWYSKPALYHGCSVFTVQCS